MKNKKVTIFCISDSLSTQAIRSSLEYLCYEVLMHYIGSADDFVKHITKTPKTPYLIIDGHGDSDSQDNAGFSLPEVHESVPLKYKFENNLIQTQQLETLLSQHPNKSKCQLILSTACMTGTQTWADVWLEHKTKNYIGFPRYPDGNSTLLFTLLLFEMLTHMPLKKAFAIARSALKNMGYTIEDEKVAFYSQT